MDLLRKGKPMSILEELKRKLDAARAESPGPNPLQEVSPAMREKIGQMTFGGLGLFCKACWGQCEPN